MLGFVNRFGRGIAVAQAQLAANGSPPATFEPANLWRSLSLVPGDLGLGLFEDRLAEAWDKCLSDRPDEAADAFRIMSAFHRPTLAAWRRGWERRLDNKARPEELSVPRGEMRPLGYVILQHAAREAYPARAHQRWIPKIPKVYRQTLLDEEGDVPSPDPYQLAILRYYRSLMPMAQEARKPMFLLTPADGAIGSSAAAVQDCRRDFESLARRIAAAAGSPLAPRPA
ncbi:hypothetical protein [Sorangium sp. So ce131]|uniref:hypothetical protein n=1 Tax=Sorangium sp. So ce131 TaxID=3133282 RepID=UPI003F63DBC7